MSIIMTPAQLVRARESRDFWREKKASVVSLWALLGCEGGESGFNWRVDSEGKEYTPKGDDGKAGGPFQHWPARAEIILKRCGKDVRNGPHLEALEGAYEEMTAPWSGFRHVWPALQAAKTLWGAETELVEKYEISKNQDTDIVKRVTIGAYLEHTIG